MRTRRSGTEPVGQANGELEIGALWSEPLRHAAASSEGENRMALILQGLRARGRDIGGGCALTRRAFSLRRRRILPYRTLAIRTSERAKSVRPAARANRL